MSGGIHFCRPEHILAWAYSLGNTVWVREVTIPPDVEFIEFDTKAKASQVILGPRKSLQDYLSTWTESMCLASVVLYGWTIQAMPDEQRTPAVCLAAVQREGDAIRCLNAAQRTHAMCLAAVQKNGEAIRYLNAAQRTPAVCLAAVQNYGMSIRFMTLEQRTPAVCQAAVQYLTPEQRNQVLARGVSCTGFGDAI